MSSIYKALVVGGSLGGVMAARVLKDCGFDVTVLERNDHQLGGAGQGIRVQPDIDRFLERYTNSSGSFQCEDISERRYFNKDGSIAWAVNERGRTTHWSSLFNSLIDDSELDYRLGSRVTKFTETSDKVTISLSSEENLSSDLVVFADGVGSVGRSKLAPEASPSYVGYVAWRGTATRSSIGESFARSLDDGLNFQLLDKS